MSASVLNQLWMGIPVGAATDAQTTLGRNAAQEWLNYRPERLPPAMEEAVRRALHRRQQAFLFGAFEYLADFIKGADSRTAQDEANDLLWRLKTVILSEARRAGLVQ
jgi:hypothetical protein